MNIGKIEKAIEMESIKERWKAFATNDVTRETIAAFAPYMSETELKARLAETSESRRMMEQCGNPPLACVTEVEEHIKAAERGECLRVEDLVQVAGALVAISRMKQYLQRGQHFGFSLGYYAENLEVFEELRESIGVTIVNEAVSDHASKYLKDLRESIAGTNEKMKARADSAMRVNKAYVNDSFSTMRNGHICIPIKKEYRYKVEGTTMGESASGATIFLEPTTCAKYYEELEMLRLEEENEVRRILYELTAQVADAAEMLREDIRILWKLDFIFSKGKLSMEMDATEPTITTERKISLTDARHPLMDRETCVPLSLSMGEGIQGVVITGPNTGGKTVALKTVALNCMLAQCGLHVCAKEATVCMHSNFLCDIGDGQNLSENLSTFSAHIKNVLDILENVNEESFVIMDELGSGTDPQEGMGIAVAILDELRKSGALFLVTTHYPEVKNYANRTGGIVNACMAFDRENLKPLYRIVIGEAGESCALHIAKRLGMPSSMLQRAAKEAYGDVIDSDDWSDGEGTAFKKKKATRIQKEKKRRVIKQAEFQRGDSVMVYPEKKIGIVCERADQKGFLTVQIHKEKVLINHKRLKLHVAAEQLYPEDYDFSVIFDSVKERKMRHDMQRKYVEGELRSEE